jgi:hypothetical protein
LGRGLVALEREPPMRKNIYADVYSFHFHIFYFSTGSKPVTLPKQVDRHRPSNVQSVWEGRSILGEGNDACETRQVACDSRQVSCETRTPFRESPYFRNPTPVIPCPSIALPLCIPWWTR